MLGCINIVEWIHAYVAVLQNTSATTASSTVFIAIAG